MWSPGALDQLQTALPVLTQSLIHQWYVTIRAKCHQLGKFTHALVFRFLLLWGCSVHIGMQCVWLTLVTVFCSSSSPVRGQTDAVWHKAQAFTKNHIVRINYMAWPKVSGTQRYFLSGNILQEFRGASARTVQKDLECGAFGQLKPTELIIYCTYMHILLIWTIQPVS